MSNKQQKRFTIEGNIGAGKSTLIKCLEKNFICFQEPVDQWTLLGEFYKNQKQFAFPFQMQVLISQFNQFKSMETIENKYIFIERSPWISKEVFIKLLNEKGCWNESNEHCYNSLYKNMDKHIDTMFFLDISPEQCFERVRQRNRFEEMDLQLDYLISLDNTYKRVLNNLPFKVVYLDATKTTLELEHDILTYISNLDNI
ncbi:thymidine kinase [Dasineura jujubifolia toursvirus 2a]|nr:thymidine kinase [Dasineura jujubifolia toursvirus 2a]